MKSPDPNLMRAYGTFEVFKEKTANVQPIAARIAQIALGRGMVAQRIRAQTGDSARQTAQAEMMNTAFRMLELAKMESAIDNANFAHAPNIMPKEWGDMPIGMTEGMIRIASAAGESMAKTANPYRIAAKPPLTAPKQLPPVPELDLPSKVVKNGPTKAPAAAASSVAEGAAQGAPDLLHKGEELWHRSGLSKGRWKYKLPLLAGAGLAAYGTLRAAKGITNWLGQESPPRTFYSGGNQLAADTNEYGHPQYALPYY